MTKVKGALTIRLVVTGGHYTPALATIEELKKRESALGGFQFYWIGHKYSLKDDRTPSAEFRTIERLGIPFYALKAGKFYQADLLELAKLPLGFFHAVCLLAKIRPRLVISFGGYLAAPVALAAFFLGIPSVTHEQTVVSGWANRFTSHFAKRIFVSWKESLSHFPKKKTILTGNPIRAAVFEKRTDRFKFRNDLPTVYITGGKQGAHVINESVRGALSTFLGKYNLIHQTGSSEVYKDYQKILLLKDQLPAKLKEHYIVQEYFGEEEIGAVFASADLIVGRSGANTVTEIAALGKPAILIPIPWVSHHEQLLNAEVLAKAGGAKIILEDQLSPTTLLQAVAQVFANFSKFQKAALGEKKLIYPNASAKIAEEIVSLLKA